MILWLWLLKSSMSTCHYIIKDVYPISLLSLLVSRAQVEMNALRAGRSPKDRGQEPETVSSEPEKLELQGILVPF